MEKVLRRRTVEMEEWIEEQPSQEGPLSDTEEAAAHPPCPRTDECPPASENARTERGRK